MQVSLTEVTAENTFNDAFHSKFPGAGQYRPGGSHFARGFAREYVIGDALGMSVVSKTLRIESSYLICTLSDEMNADNLRQLIDTSFEVDGRAYTFSGIRAESYSEPYSDPSLGIEVTYTSKG